MAHEPGSSRGSSAPLDLQELLADPEALPAAMELARQSKVEWVARTSKLLSGPAAEPEFFFQVK